MLQPSAVSPVAVLVHLEARARFVAGELPQSASADAGSARYIGLRLGPTGLLAPMGQILEILPYPELSRVPGAKPWLRGISQVRGHLLSVVDLALFLGGELTAVRRGTRILMVQHEDTLVGLMVDEVLGMKHHLGVPNGFLPEPGQEWLAHAVELAADVEGARWGLLDIGSLLTDPEFARAAL